MKFQIKKRTAQIGACALVLTPMWALPAQAAPDGSDVVINEVYARGGSENQPYKNKFIELYNPTDKAISLDGMSLQYFSANGTGGTNTTDLTGHEIAAGGYFLVQGGSNGSVGAELPEPDLTSSLSPGGTNGAIALVDGTSAMTGVGAGDLAGDPRFVDFVGFGTSNKFETSAAAYTGGNREPGSINRTDGVDTDNNSVDFTLSTWVTPQNSGGTGTDPEGPGEPGEPTDPEAITPIAEIQGTGSATPLRGQKVTTNGVVTAAYKTGGFNGFYLQTAGTGTEIGNASHGIFVYMANGNFTAEVGDYVEVTGTADEFYNLTQLTGPTVTKLDDEVTAPVPVAVTAQDLATDAQRERFEGMILDPNAVDLTVTDTYSTNQYAEVALAIGDAPLATPTDIYNPVTEKAEHDALAAENAASMLVLDDGSSWNYMTNNTAKNTPIPYLNLDVPVRVGASVDFADPVVLDYRNDLWKLQPTEQVTAANDDFAVFEDTRADVEVAPVVDGDVTISTFNVLNYFVNLGADERGCRAYTDRQGNPIAANGCNVRGAFTQEAFENQEGKIVAAIQELDSSIVGLEEIENSAKFGDDRDLAVETLVNALNDDAGFEKWAYAESPSRLPSLSDEDVIRLAFIYQVDEVTPTGESKILIGSSAFNNAREPLGQSWQALDSNGEPVGEEFATITNHFKSKGSGTDDGTGQGNANPDRVRQANALLDFAEAEYGDMAVFLVGDFNSYSAEDPLRVFEADGYVNLLREKSEQDDTHYYTYSFSKNVGSLDHIFASSDAHNWVVDTAVWNINSVEAIALEYSRYNYNAAELFEPGTPFRSSDHDPIKVGLDIPGFEDEVATEVTPEAPTFADNTITIPVVEGVEYLIGDEVVTGDVAIEADTTVTARAADGYVLAEGATASWDFEYVAPVVEVTPVAPTFADNTITIPVVEGVEYLIGDEVVTGDVAIEADTTVTARAADGYVLAEGATSSWNFKYVAPEEPVKPDPIPESGNIFLIANNWDSTTHEIAFAYGRRGDEVLVGDWNGDGKDTLAVRRGNTIFVNNELKGGKADTSFNFGRDTDEVLVGDWNGDGKDTFGVRRGHEFFLNNTLKGGNAEISFKYGRDTDEVLVGDWNGDDVDTIAVRRGNTFHINNNLRGGNATTSYNYGRSTDVAFAGDFDGDGVDTVSLRRGNVFHINNSLTGGNADSTVGYGRKSDNVLIGDWDGDGVDTPAVNRVI
ncbi:ExeM/NucH family extracellular endonuclease [Flaviflexus massiliensis]|uniref:ExeM/NucH family extracellular endonuclease n=1 Tax=Flaviflexus massiliensis TaxID=1522309 RepID=UPI0006D5A199|nr:ExeM/NucH family extracellular endonuclease [Flaviflexus massiliensis]